MSKLVYSGTFEKEANLFKGHDNLIISYLKDIAGKIGELNTSWNDDVSGDFLNGFNNCLTEVKGNLSQCHEQINQYFLDIQNVLNVYRNGSSIEIPELGNVELSAINASSVDGSILFDEDQVNAILAKMKATIHDIIADNNDFSPSPVSLYGSSDDILSAVQSNLDAAARSYQLIESPLSEIVSMITKVQETYAKRSATISQAKAN